MISVRMPGAHWSWPHRISWRNFLGLLWPLRQYMDVPSGQTPIKRGWRHGFALSNYIVHKKFSYAARIYTGSSYDRGASVKVVQLIGWPESIIRLFWRLNVPSTSTLRFTAMCRWQSGLSGATSCDQRGKPGGRRSFPHSPSAIDALHRKVLVRRRQAGILIEVHLEARVGMFALRNPGFSIMARMNILHSLRLRGDI